MDGSTSRPDGAGDRAAAAAQVFVEDPATPLVGDDDRHHLVRVLRLRPGEVVVASDGRGRWSLCRFEGGDDNDLLVAEGPVRTEVRPTDLLTVAFAPAKGDRPEWVVQKLTELGVDRIVPLRAARSVVRWEGDRGPRAVERLQRVAREAAAQSRRVWLPEVSPVADVDSLAAETGLRLAERGGPPPSAETSAVAVGPEGGWDAAELALAEGTVGLGPHVLRSETAAVAAGAILAALRAGTVGERPS